MRLATAIKSIIVLDSFRQIEPVAREKLNRFPPFRQSEPDAPLEHADYFVKCTTMGAIEVLGFV